MKKFMSDQATTGVVAVVRPWEIQVSGFRADVPVGMRTLAPTFRAFAPRHTSALIAPTYVQKNGTDVPTLGSLFRSPPV